MVRWGVLPGLVSCWRARRAAVGSAARTRHPCLFVSHGANRVTPRKVPTRRARVVCILALCLLFTASWTAEASEEAPLRNEGGVTAAASYGLHRMIIATICALFAVLNAALYASYPKRKENLFYCLGLASALAAIVALHASELSKSPAFHATFLHLYGVLATTTAVLGLALLQIIGRNAVSPGSLAGFAILGAAALPFEWLTGYRTMFFVWIIAFEYFRQFVMFVSPRRKRDWMLWTALVCFLIGLVLGALDDLGVFRMGPLTEYAAWYGFCAFMIFTTFMFAREFGAIAISLENLAATLEQRVAMRTDELSAANAELQEEVRERRRAQETLVAHERRLEAVYEGTWDAVWLLSKEGVIDCNRRTLEMFGYATKEDFARAYPAALSPEFQADGQETRALRAAVIQSAIETGHRTFAWTHRRANGELFPAEVLLSAFEYEGRMVWQATIRDMTERKRMETALRESEQRMADIINSLPDPTFVIDSQHRVIAWNRAIEEQTGVKREDMLGKGNYEYSLPYHGDRRPLLVDQIVDSNLVTPTEYDGRKVVGDTQTAEAFAPHMGSGRYFWLSATALRDSQGHMVGALESIRDITERKKAEEELKLRNVLLSTQQEVTIDGILVVDENGKILSFNRRFVEMWGIPSDVIESRSDERALESVLSKLVEPQQFINKVKYLYEHRQETSRDEIALVDGRTFDRYSGPMLGADGRYYGRVWYFRDISERKEMERNLSRAKEAAEAASRAKGGFLANMSHEIRTPLNAILGFSQLMLRDSDLTAQQREHLDIINRSGEHLLALINDILEMSKIEAGRATLNPVTFDLHALLSDLQAMLRVRTEPKGLSLSLSVAADMPRYIVTDEGKLRQVLINLLGNAVKFTEQGGIGLRARVIRETADAFRLGFEVADSGIGIPADKLSAVFEAFEQAGATKAEGGTGLGLAISRQFVRLMGGDLRVSSELGTGSVFSFEVDAGRGLGDAVPSKSAVQRVIGLKPGTAPTRIAIVDDKKYNRQLLAKLLATVGFEVREAADGQEALALLSEWRPALMLMDMRMPVMDGYEATRRIKAMPDGGNTLIVGVTASAFEEKKNEVLAAGVDGFLAKPFKEEQLFGVIHDLLGIEYEYAAAEAAETGADSAISSRAMLQAVATLPKELVARLREAVSLGHMEDLAALFDEVASFAPDFAGRLRDLSDQYEYNTLAEILGEADGSSKE